MPLNNPFSSTPLRQRGGQVCEDFIGGGFGAVATRISGAGSNVTVDSAALADLGGNPGWVLATTGTATTGRAGLAAPATAPAGILIGHGTFFFETLIHLPVLSDGTETYTVRAGLNDVAGLDATDGVYFRYTHSVNSGKLQCVTRSNSVETATDSGITVVAATNYRLTIVVNAAASSVEFYINGALVATITTNIPTGAGRQTAFAVEIVKSAGTTARTMLIDFVEMYCDLTVTR